MKDYTNYPPLPLRNSLLNSPIGVKSLFKTEIGFAIASALCYLSGGWQSFGRPISLLTVR